MGDSTEFARKLITPYAERIEELEEEVELLRDLCSEMYHAARLLDANAHIVGLKLKSEAREGWERRMVELGVDV